MYITTNTDEMHHFFQWCHQRRHFFMRIFNLNSVHSYNDAPNWCYAMLCLVVDWYQWIYPYTSHLLPWHDDFHSASESTIDSLSPGRYESCFESVIFPSAFQFRENFVICIMTTAIYFTHRHEVIVSILKLSHDDKYYFQICVELAPLRRIAPPVEYP